MFPKYKITNEQPLAIGNDSLAVSEDEESIANGNYQATLTLDTLVRPQLVAEMEQRAKQDTLWKQEGNIFTFTKRTKKERYQVVVDKQSRQVTVTHQKL